MCLYVVYKMRRKWHRDWCRRCWNVSVWTICKAPLHPEVFHVACAFAAWRWRCHALCTRRDTNSIFHFPSRLHHVDTHTHCRLNDLEEEKDDFDVASQIPELSGLRSNLTISWPCFTWNSLEEEPVITTNLAGTWKRRPVFISQERVKVFVGASFIQSPGTPCLII